MGSRLYAKMVAFRDSITGGWTAKPHAAANAGTTQRHTYRRFIGIKLAKAAKDTALCAIADGEAAGWPEGERFTMATVVDGRSVMVSVVTKEAGDAE